MKFKHTNPNIKPSFNIENNHKVPKFPQKLPGEFWGVTTFFNPAKFENKYKNYKLFRKKSKKQGLKLLTVELSFGDENFELKKDDADMLIQIRTNRKNVLWQKEALINVGIKKLPEACDKFAWIDCDILFDNDKWVNETSQLLEDYMVVQPYSESVRMHYGQKRISNINKLPVGFGDGERKHSFCYCISNFGESVLSDFNTYGHTGFAWAARRSIFSEVGLYDQLIIGSSDVLMAYAFCRSGKSFKTKYRSEFMDAHQNEWIKIVKSIVQGSIFATPGFVAHLWHGESKNRSYVNRHLFLQEHNFDPVHDIAKNSDGIWIWSSEKPGLHNCLEKYFFNRMENKKKLSRSTEILIEFNAQMLGILGRRIKKISPKTYKALKVYFPDIS